MDTHEQGKENYDESLIKCDQINTTVPSIFYAIHLLKRVDSTFSQNSTLLLAEEGLLELNDLLDIHDNPSEYVNRYREILIKVLQNMSQFILDLKNLDRLSEQKQIRLARIINELAYSQQLIVKIIDSIP